MVAMESDPTSDPISRVCHIQPIMLWSPEMSWSPITNHHASSLIHHLLYCSNKQHIDRLDKHMYKHVRSANIRTVECQQLLLGVITFATDKDRMIRKGHFFML
ncbi:hypothetical protein TNCV_2466531 [Trichonephila clavipes]|nr:hypothetical protein TNCV_2466531 [Trichonephila clavipes]